MKYFGDNDSNWDAMQVKSRANAALEKFYDIPIEKIPNNFLMEHMEKKYREHSDKISGKVMRSMLSTFFNIVRKAYHLNESECAIRIYSAINERGVKFWRVSFHNIIIKIFCQEEKVDQALEVFQRIKDHGTNPDIFSFNILLQKFTELKDSRSVNLLLKFMRELDVKPTIVTTTILLKFAINSQGQFTLNDVRSFLKSDESDSVLASMVIFEALKIKDFKLAVDCYNFFKSNGVSPESRGPLNWFLAVSCMKQERELADELFEMMLRKSIPISPTSLNFYIIANLTPGRHDKARRATKELHRVLELQKRSPKIDNSVAIQ
jgi:pentatricopeptide repeat protein